MAMLTDYKGLDVVEDATRDGGIALTGNFKELADRAPYQTGSNPGASDDETKGFAPGDQWLNTSTSVFWACVSNGTGTAVWKSLYKRTATGLELIPAESAESVQVVGLLSASSRVGIQRTPTTVPLEIQQESGDSVGGLRVYNHAGVAAAEIATTAGGSAVFRRVGAGNVSINSSSVIQLLTTNYVGIVASSGVSVGSPLFTPSAMLDINSDKFRLRTAKTPSSSSDDGNQGDICWDSGHVYVCVAANSWKRAALGTW